VDQNNRRSFFACQRHGRAVDRVTTFKARRLALIDDVARGKTPRVLLIKHNRPVAAVAPSEGDAAELWGPLRGTVKVVPCTDLTQGTREVWEADT
jgi:antitoxin (DNA-binding transcriptional repressor) of toxin-antitoxin stability system